MSLFFFVFVFVPLGLPAFAKVEEEEAAPKSPEPKTRCHRPSPGRPPEGGGGRNRNETARAPRGRSTEGAGDTQTATGWQSGFLGSVQGSPRFQWKGRPRRGRAKPEANPSCRGFPGRDGHRQPTSLLVWTHKARRGAHKTGHRSPCSPPPIHLPCLESHAAPSRSPGSPGPGPPVATHLAIGVPLDLGHADALSCQFCSGWAASAHSTIPLLCQRGSDHPWAPGGDPGEAEAEEAFLWERPPSPTHTILPS